MKLVNYRNYVINKLTCEIMENKPLGSRMYFFFLMLRVVYFTVFGYKSVNLFFEKLINIKVILFLIHELFR